MMNRISKAVFVLSIAGAAAVFSAGSASAAAGAPPGGPIEAPKTGADLKHACGQSVEGYGSVEGERMLREMLIVQCWAVVSAVVDLVGAGEYAVDGKPVWQCVKDPADHEALTKAFVTWVGRRPALMRKPAPVAFVEAVEMSEKCRN